MRLILRRVLTEPLSHFIVIGICLFAGNAIWEKFAACGACEIHISSAELERQAAIFVGENNRQPSDEDLLALLYAHIEEEALMREARKLGLDEGDIIIRRRLAQKMRFMVEKSPLPRPPREKVLEAWFEQYKDEFTKPETRSFSHVYFSPQTRGDKVALSAAESLKTITQENWQSHGDPFLLQNTFHAQPYEQVAQNFGKEFATSVFALETTPRGAQQSWQGPLSSSFGLHLVQLTAIIPIEIPEFDKVRPQVEAHWIKTHHAAENQKSIRRVIDNYKVIVDDIPAQGQK